MFKKTITYTDFNGTERKEDFYFNLTKAELMQMQLETDGGLDTKIKKIVDSKDQREIVKFFKKIILSAYGIKSDDGKRFVKNDKIREEFEHSEAYSELFMKLATDANEASAFINGILPVMPKEITNDKAPLPVEEKKN